MKKYYLLLLFVLLIGCDQEPVISRKEIRIDIEADYTVNNVRRFQREVTFVNLTDTLGAPAPVSLRWVWGDGKNSVPTTDTIMHTFPQGDSTFIIELQLIRSSNGEVVSSKVDSINFDRDYPVQSPYTVTNLTAQTAAWDANVTWERSDANSISPSIFMSLSTESDFSSLIDIENGLISSSNITERTGITTTNNHHFKNLRSSTTYYYRLELEEEEDYVSINEGSFTTTSISLPSITINTTADNGYLFITNTRNNHFYDSIASVSTLLLSNNRNLDFIYQEEDTFVYAKPFYQDVIFTSMEETLQRASNETSNSVTSSFTSENKDLYYTSAQGIFDVNNEHIAAQVYFYQDNYRIFIGDNTQNAAYNLEGIHITLGPSLPSEGSYFYLNSNNTKVRDTSLTEEIGLFGEQGITSYRLYIHQNQNDTLYCGVNNVVTDNQKKFKLVFSDPSIDQNYSSEINHLYFHTIDLDD